MLILKNTKNQKGFTLIEVMVAVTIFTVIVTIGIGSLLVINNNYRQSQINRQAVDNLSFVLEDMSRMLRTAQSWDVVLPTFIEFIDQEGSPVIITLDTHSNNNTGIVKKDRDQITSISRGSFLTSDAIDIQEFVLELSGGNNGSDQSYFTMFIRGITRYRNEDIPVIIQTGISKRSIDE